MPPRRGARPIALPFASWQASATLAKRLALEDLDPWGSGAVKPNPSAEGLGLVLRLECPPLGMVRMRLDADFRIAGDPCRYPPIWVRGPLKITLTSQWAYFALTLS